VSTLQRLLTLVLLLGLGVGTIPGAAPATAASTLADSCPRDLDGPVADSPITGYFIFYGGNVCDARQRMQSLHRLGADTAITFGYSFREVQVDAAGRVLTAAGEPDPAWADCLDDQGRTCWAAARAAIGDSTIRRVLRYASAERLGPAVLRCTQNGRDAEVVHDGRRYQRILLPVGDDGDCTAAHDSYDLVLVANGSVGAADPVETTLAEADAYGIDFLMGMPVPDKDPKAAWLPDATKLDSVTTFSARLFADWAVRHADHPSFVGVYQSTEMPVKANSAWDVVYRLYDLQHELVGRLLPGKMIMISPYQDARRDKGVPIAGAEAAFVRMAQTAPPGVRIAVAPQDGRGTSKVGIYFPNQIDDIVDPQLFSHVGQVTYREAYEGTTGDYYASEARGRDGLDRPGAELWANVELMARGVGEGQQPCGSNAEPSIAATWPRVAQQLSAAGHHASKVIAYMYDGIMTCTNPGIESLENQLLAAAGQPVPVEVTPLVRSGVPGTVIMGYHVRHSTVTITQERRDGTATDPVTFGVREVKAVPLGRGNAGRLDTAHWPAGMEALWIPWVMDNSADLQPWLRITMANRAGAIPYGEYVTVPTAG